MNDVSTLTRSMFEVSANGGAIPAALDMNRLATVYIKMREARQKLKQEYEAADAAIETKQDIIAAHMLRFLQETNQNSSSTPSGTIYRQEEIIPTGADWDALYSWIKEHDAFDFLERRIKKTSVAQYMEEHDGAIPPGVSVLRKFVVRVRKSSKRTKVGEDENE